MVKAKPFRPLLAATYTSETPIAFPVIASPKVDGYRCLTPNEPLGVFDTYSRSLKPIANTHTRAITRRFHGLDGELCLGPPNAPNTFNATDAALKKHGGNPDVTLWAFDLTDVDPRTPFVERYQMLVERFNRDMRGCGVVEILQHYVISDMESLLDYETAQVAAGFEGIMYRSPAGPYKYGRSTLNESYLVKWKRLDTAIATVVGFVEQTTNGNEATTDARGLTVRSSHQANKVGKGTLGSFICTAENWKESFNVGTMEGVTAEMRQYIWDNREEFVGRQFLFEYQVVGSKERPRIPSFKRWV